LLPGADFTRLEEATADMFKRLWGVRMGQVRHIAVSEAQYFLREYRDLVYEAPFQFPADMLFIMRAIGILSGMATNLDPDFDPWTETIPFAEQLAAEELRKDWQGWLQEITTLGQLMFKLPAQVERVFTQAERGNLTIQLSLAPDARKIIQRLEQSVNRLAWGVITAILLISGINLYVGSQDKWLSGGLIFLALVTFLWGMLRR
jgi:predicted unusual protein kinase regulating ubiquinone biosynthesis (AarF/ABC1/UbiB family)